ncbi:MAG TPA: SH3 domain-containing protein [Verrucomicrobiae bacterium]|nr:SH3 domain-containing protein [Verrucomicrobiae bacterium]
MKMKLGTICLTMISTSLLAQQVTNAPPPATIQTPAPSPAITAPASAETNAPAAPAKKKAEAKKPKHAPRKAAAAELKTVPLVPGPAIVAANRVNVRGQAKLNSEIIARMTNGEAVTVIEEVKLKHSGPEEPSAWAKIELPQKARVWVHASYIDPATKTVTPKKLNLRGGPGENFSVIGTLTHGDAVKEIQTKGNWMEIEATTNSYAFMAAQYLTQEPAVIAAAAPPEAAQVNEPPAVAEAPTNTPTVIEPAVDTNAAPSIATNEAPAVPAVEEPPPPRIVQREGIVRYTASIQSPTMFELISPDNHRPIDFLFSTSPSLDLNRYKGLRIIVTGEEGLDERWKNTPIITIQRIQVIE